jgi:hypothetical protein
MPIAAQMIRNRSIIICHHELLGRYQNRKTSNTKNKITLKLIACITRLFVFKLIASLYPFNLIKLAHQFPYSFLALLFCSIVGLEGYQPVISQFSAGFQPVFSRFSAGFRLLPADNFLNMSLNKKTRTLFYKHPSPERYKIKT